MDQVLVFLANIPGLSLFLLFSGLLMVGLELRKLSKIAMSGVKPTSFSFPLILPGLAFLSLGFMLQSP